MTIEGHAGQPIERPVSSFLTEGHSGPDGAS